MFDYPTAFSSWAPGDGSEEDHAYLAAYHSGRVTMGPETEAFEHEIAAYHGRKFAVAVNSGSSANLVAIAAIAHQNRGFRNRTPSFTAAVPAIAWATTYAPLVQYGAELKLLDVDDTWNAVSPEDDPDLHVICSVLGSPVSPPSSRFLVLEDNCESLGARLPGGRLTGTLGLISTGSGFYSHQLSAFELGWILTDDPALDRLCRLLRNHGNSGFLSENPEFAASYDFTHFGYNLRPVEPHCAVARVQLARLDEMIAHRRWNLDYFKTLTYSLPISHQRTTGSPSPFGLVFELPSNLLRERLVGALRAASIDARLPTGGSFGRHHYGAPWRSQPTPNADRIHSRGLFLGNAPRPLQELIDRAVNVMREVL